jgi:DNA-directed RNA polymerase specialized sigma24 family protein
MDRPEAIKRLPSTYAAIIDLLDQGTSETGIAERLGVEPDTVPPLVAVARAKLARLLGQPGQVTDDGYRD